MFKVSYEYIPSFLNNPADFAVRLKPSFNLPTISCILLVITFFINDQYPYLTIPVNGIKVSGNFFNKPKYLDPKLKIAKARSA